MRAALGARSSRLLASIFSPAAWQPGLGALVGCLLGGLLLLGDGSTWREAAIFLGGVVVLMLSAGLVGGRGRPRGGR